MWWWKCNLAESLSLFVFFTKMHNLYIFPTKILKKTKAEFNCVIKTHGQQYKILLNPVLHEADRNPNMIQSRKIFWMDVKSGSLTDVARLCAAFARETHEPTTGCRRLFHCVGDWLLENAGLFQMLDFLSLAAGKKFRQFFFLPSENEENKKLCSAAAPSRIQRFTEPIIPETWKRAVLILDYGVRARARALCSHQNLLGVQGEDGFAGRIAALVTVWVLQLENWGFWKESLDFNNTYLFVFTERAEYEHLLYSIHRYRTNVPQRVFPERWGRLPEVSRQYEHKTEQSCHLHTYATGIGI